MMWQSFPDSPPVWQLCRGHIYYAENIRISPIKRLMVYIRRGMGKSGPKMYAFYILGSSERFPGSILRIHPDNIDSYRIKEVSRDELPLYLDMHTTDKFDALLKGGR